MSENGENLVVMWMSNWWLALEWTKEWPGYQGLGRYSLRNAWRLDYVLAQAKKHGIYVHLVVDNHGKLALRVDSEWDLNPYNADQGGPLAHPDEYFTRPEAKKYYRQKLRYLIARWGYSPNLFGLELWGELNLTGSESDQLDVAQCEWHREMGRYIKDIDPWDHLITTHFSNDYRRVDPNIASLKELDYIVSDAYRATGSLVELLELTAQANGRYGKPCFVTEFGGNWNSTTPDRLKADLFTGIWSSWFSDAAATPLLWWFDFVDKEDLYPWYRAFASFIDGESKVGKFSCHPQVTVPGARILSKVRAVSLQDRGRADIWVYDEIPLDIWPGKGWRPVIKGAEIHTTGLAPGKYALEFWDTLKGEPFQRVPLTVDTNGEARVKLPTFKIALAMKLRPRRGKGQ